MTLQMLEYFTVVAECLNISDAAKKLYVSQPAISRQILALESELGVQLFYRTKPYMSLTEAGHNLREGAEKIVRMSHEWVYLAKKSTNTVSGSLSVGYSGHLEYNYLFKVFSHISKHYPACSFRFVKAPLDVLSRGLQDGTMDIVFCPLTNFEKRRSNEVELHTIKCSSSVLVVSENHRLANRASVSMAELAGEELVTFFRKDSVVHSDLIMQFCKEGGFSARISYEVSDINTFLLIIAANMAVGFAGATIEDILPPGSGIKLLPVHELSTNKLNIGAAWKKDNPNEVLAMLIRVVRQLYPDISEKGK